MSRIMKLTDFSRRPNKSKKQIQAEESAYMKKKSGLFLG